MVLGPLLALPLLTALACAAPLDRRWTERLNALGAFATLGAGLAAAVSVFVDGPVTSPGDWLYADALSALLIVVIVVVCFLAALYSIDHLRRQDGHGGYGPRRYFVAYHVFAGSMLAAVLVNNVGLMWVAVEATTIVSALLVGSPGTRAALEAAWKYLVLCTVGITFALFGVLLTYYASVHAFGAEASLNWTALVAGADRLDPAIMKLAFAFILVGFGTKAGLAPLHTWLPDAHSQAPAPISAVLSGVLIKCGLYAVIRFHLILVGTVGPAYSGDLLLGFGLFSVALAVPFILVQRDLKRLLAYHSVEHIGLITVAIGLGGPLGLFAGMLHLFNHAMAKALLFFVAGDLSQRYGTTQMGRIRGAVRAMPRTGVLLLVGTLAITGLPPFAIFVTEFGIVAAAFARGNVVVGIVLIAALVTVFAGAFGHAMDMALGRPHSRVGPALGGRMRPLAMAVPVGLGILFGVYIPAPVVDAIQGAVAVLSRWPRT